MPMEKETESFTDSVGHEYNYDVFTLRLKNSDLATRKYVLVTKYGSPIISITTHSNGSIRVGTAGTSDPIFTKDTYRIIVEFQAHILSRLESA